MLDFDAFDVLSFDCYGTLIDWEEGIIEALRPIFATHRIPYNPEKALELFARLESEIERDEDFPEYRTVLCLVLAGFAERFDFLPTNDQLMEFADSIYRWPPFPDSAEALAALKTKYKLAIISNTDDDIFARSAQALGVDFDWVITSQQLRSYKPAEHNFRAAVERIGVPKERILHVAQSMYHDIVPASAFGLSTVWVDRRQTMKGTGATPPATGQADVRVPDLRALAKKVGVM